MSSRPERDGVRLSNSSRLRFGHTPIHRRMQRVCARSWILGGRSQPGFHAVLVNRHAMSLQLSARVRHAIPRSLLKIPGSRDAAVVVLYTRPLSVELAERDFARADGLRARSSGLTEDHQRTLRRLRERERRLLSHQRDHRSTPGRSRREPHVGHDRGDEPRRASQITGSRHPESCLWAFERHVVRPSPSAIVEPCR